MCEAYEPLAIDTDNFPDSIYGTLETSSEELGRRRIALPYFFPNWDPTWINEERYICRTARTRSRDYFDLALSLQNLAESNAFSSSTKRRHRGDFLEELPSLALFRRWFSTEMLSFALKFLRNPALSLGCCSMRSLIRRLVQL